LIASASLECLVPHSQRGASAHPKVLPKAVRLALDRTEAQVGNPKYKDAVAAPDEAKRQLAHTVARAPFAGIVTNVPSLQPGQYLAAAATAFNIVSTDRVWVQASPKETELTYVKMSAYKEQTYCGIALSYRV
jgi:membrane fusion protein (multidrug efflux system)